MAKNTEELEVDEFLLDEQNNNIEDQLIEEEEDESEDASLRFRVRPARASLTHNAIKSELLKMNKQNRQDSNEDAEENLSRSARKRKKRKEKILEERRASGGRQFEDDLDHFKSIPISRRRSSVLPFTSTIATLPAHNNNDSGFCSSLKCIFWILLVVGTLIGLIMIWPTVAEVDLAEPIINQGSDENLQPEVEQPNHNEQLNEQADQILNEVDKLSEELANEDDNQEGNQNEESLGAFSYITNFFATEDSPATEQAAVEQDNEQTNENEATNNDENNEDVNEVPIGPQTLVEENNAVDEGFEEANEIVVEESLADSIPERYQSVVDHDNFDDSNDDENQQQACVIGGQIYDNLDENQCTVLQERHRDLEKKLREQEDLIRYQQEQQQEQSENNNDEQFYFF